MQITINGITVWTRHHEVDYATVLRLAGKNPEHNWAITWRPRRGQGGALVPGTQRVRIRPGMVFCVDKPEEPQQ